MIDAGYFWAHVDKGSECWNWTGHLGPTGYGYYKSGKLAHRIAWEIKHGERPGDLMVLHRCDNRRCVRPGHLFLGTAADNTADMLAKGRHFRNEHAPRGERATGAKFTDAQAAEIRREYEAGGVGQRTLAAKYGVPRPRIKRIVRYQSYAAKGAA